MDRFQAIGTIVMLEKYDLNRMLEEIREDEQGEESRNRELSQETIKKMALERLKKRNAERD